ncbi:MFS transporter [Cypionkella psychrotolerans]|uniref:MFS transporter n=1 Tax=Cypionkella psychrotolerans TaxID=1678131 RepID=UPI0006B4A0C5|nr:MFS transporter [Cypionkella psychrotolerans]
MLIVVLASYLMILLDTSIVITGLPDIRDGLDFFPAGLSGVQNAYTLSFGGFLMLGARAGDLFGRRRVYLAGVALFTLASLVIGLAPNPATLLTARAVQGIGAAILAPTTLALLSTHFAEGEERNRAVAIRLDRRGWGQSWVGASLGLVLGGIFAGWISWRVGFLINVPVGLALHLAAARLLPETEATPGRVDIAGAVTSTLGMGALVFGIVRSASSGWQDHLTLGLVAAGLALVACFLGMQARTAQPLLPLHLFADKGRAGAYGARALFLGAMVSFFFFSTQLMQGVLHMTPVQVGFGFLPMTVVTFLISLLLPRLLRRFGGGVVLAAAFLCAALGLVWLAQAQAGASYWIAVGLPMLWIGLGNGAALAPLTVAGVRRVTPQDAGAASGLVNAAHQLGGTLGLAVLVTVFAAAMRGAPTSDAMVTHGISAGLYGAAVLQGLGLIVTLSFVIRADKAHKAV